MGALLGCGFIFLRIFKMAAARFSVEVISQLYYEKIKRDARMDRDWGPIPCARVNWVEAVARLQERSGHLRQVAPFPLLKVHVRVERSAGAPVDQVCESVRMGI